MTYSAFQDERLVGAGDLVAIVRAAYAAHSADLVVIDDATGHTLDLDLRGSLAEALERLQERAAPAAPARGRPKLGVVAREVTLLPRHWSWLSAPPGGASAALRRLVDQARREHADEDLLRKARDAAYRAATTLCGNRAGYEEAIRALFADDLSAFHLKADAWPADIAAYLKHLTAPLSASA